MLDGVGYTVTFNIRDKGKSQYQYLIDVKENGYTVSHTALESLRRAYRVSTNNRVTQPDPFVNTHSMQGGRLVIINKNKAKRMLGTIGVQPSELTSIVDLAKTSLSQLPQNVNAQNALLEDEYFIGDAMTPEARSRWMARSWTDNPPVTAMP